MTIPVATDVAPTWWQAFLARQDMAWKALPSDWDEAPFLGNGRLGMILWFDSDGVLRLEVSRGDLYDHRHVDGWLVRPSVLFTTCRLPNGQLRLAWQGDRPAGTMRLDLWNAELTGELVIGGSRCRLRCLVHAESDVIVLRLEGHAAVPEVAWHPQPAKSTRSFRVPPGLEVEPYPQQRRVDLGDGVLASVQDLPGDPAYHTEGLPAGSWATAWLMRRDPAGITIFTSCRFTPAGDGALAEAAAAVRAAASAGLAALLTSHRRWWHAFYPRSLVSLPEPRLESFYWIQLYKLGSASRRGGPLLDLMGPWFRTTDWPAAWWNLNIQLTYWPCYMANHLEEAEPLLDALWSNRASLAANAGAAVDGAYAIGRAAGPDCRADVGSEVGNLPWAMHNLWLHWRSCMDDTLLRERILPLMVGAFRHLRGILREHSDGRLELPPTASPEYTDAVDSCSYTLACLRWLCGAIIAADARLKAGAPAAGECRDVLARLEPYPVDPATGYMVGRGVPFAESHRHWSHLFMIHPFREIGFDEPAEADLARRSLANWTARPERFAGYSWLGAAAMHAAAGEGDQALGLLRTFLATAPLPNTLYREGNPVIETPLACARVVQEMLIDAHDGLIRIFPSVPAAWDDAVFADLRCEGAFLVSARRRAGRTVAVRIRSLAGEPCRVRTGLPGMVSAQGGAVVHDSADGITTCELAQGGEVLLGLAGAPPESDFTPLEAAPPEQPWGGRTPLDAG